jgi:hypothetical protein
VKAPESRKEWLSSESFSEMRNTFCSILAATGEDSIIPIYLSLYCLQEDSGQSKLRLSV